MRGDVRGAFKVCERFSSVRVLLLAWVIAGGLILGGCGGSSEEEAAVETPEEITAEETTQETTALRCTGFSEPGGVEQFYSSATREQKVALDLSATPVLKEALDLNGNKIPCFAAGYDRPGGHPKGTPVLDIDIFLLDCQFREIAEGLGQEETGQLFEELLDEATETGTNVQTLFAKQGYTCNTLAADLLGREN